MLTDAQRAVLTEYEIERYNMADINDLLSGVAVCGLIVSLADTRIQLAEARRDAERVAWLIARQTTHFFPCLHPYDSKWCLNTDEDWFIECGPANKPPTFTPESRAIIDAAMAAEEQVT